MISAITCFAIAMIGAVILTPLVRRIALDIGAVDLPTERRVHHAAIPRLGGIALVAAFLGSLLVLFGLETEVARVFFADPLLMVGLACGATIVCTLGIVDDVRGVRAWVKLWVQIMAAVIAYMAGFRIDSISLPLLGDLDMGIFAAPVTVLWVVAIVNALNLIDGLDGLAAGVAFFACVTNFVVATIHGDAVVMLLSASLGGAILGFLVFNFNPASIFMGDSGSMFLGYVLATTSVLGNQVKSSTTVAILVPLIALGLPIMDTLFAMVRRLLERRPIFSPDQGHIHHRLLAMGVTHRRAVLILYAVSILFASGAIVVAIGRNWQVGGALVILSITIIGVVRSVGNFRGAMRRWSRHERRRPEMVEVLRDRIPAFLQRVESQRDAKDVAQVLLDFKTVTCLLEVELTGVSDQSPLPTFCHGQRDSIAPPPSRERVTAVYPLAASGPDAYLRFSWHTDQGDVPPEADILLQLLVDACDKRISRTERARERVSAGHLRPL